MDDKTQIYKAIKPQEEITEIDLVDLAGFLLSRLPMLILSVLVGALSAGLITWLFIPNKYTATSQLYMVSASSDSVVNLADLNIGTTLSSDYVELMRTRPIIEDVIDSLDLEYTYEELIKMLDLSVISNTRIVKISATTLDPEESMKIANCMATISKRELPKVMDAPTPSIAELAVLPTKRSSPSLSRNVLLGAALLLGIVLLILTAIYTMDDTIKSSEDLEKAFGVMPLSVIPEGSISWKGNEGSSSDDDKKHRRPRWFFNKSKSKAKKDKRKS